MSDGLGEKQHPATPHRRQQARQQGQTPRSHDLASTGVLLAAIVAIYFFGSDVARQLAELMTFQLSSPEPRMMSPSLATQQLQGILGICLRLLLPITGLVFGAGILAHWSQGGFTWQPERLAPNWKHFNLAHGFQRCFSASSGFRTLMGGLKILVVVVIAGGVLHRRGAEILSSHALEISELTRLLADLFFWMSLQIAIGLGSLALIDYGYQYWRHEQELRMTDQELREELRMLQGDPQLQARRRALQSRAKPVARQVATDHSNELDGSR